MLPMRWDPFKDLSRELGTLHQEMDELFRRTFGLGRETPEGTALMTLPLNTFVKDGVFHVLAEVPGVERKDLDVTIDGHTLTIRGERKLARETKEQDYLLREWRAGAFLRRLTLPEGVDGDKIHATCKEGILEITMPTTATAGGRKVAIEGPEAKTSREVH